MNINLSYIVLGHYPVTNSKILEIVRYSKGYFVNYLEIYFLQIIFRIVRSALTICQHKITLVLTYTSNDQILV